MAQRRSTSKKASSKREVRAEKLSAKRRKWRRSTSLQGVLAPNYGDFDAGSIAVIYFNWLGGW